MSATWLLAFLPALLILGLALYIKAHEKSWLHPGGFFSLSWAGYTMAPLLLAPDFDVKFQSTLAIFTACGLVAAGSLVGSKGLNRRLELSSPRFPWLSEFCVVGCLAGFAAVFFFLWEYKSEFDRFFSMATLKMLPSFFYTKVNVQTPPLLTRCFLLLSYSSVLFSGVLWSLSRPMHLKLPAILPFIPPLLLTIIEGRRARLLVPLLLCLSCYLACRVWQGRSFSPAGRRWPFVLFFGFVLIGGITLGSQVSRLRRGLSIDTLRLSWSNYRGGLFGYLSGFSQWFDSGGLHWIEPKWGANTFAGIFHIFGLKKRETGLYTDIVALGRAPHDSSTNVYTVFRGLIEDFTMPGAVLILFAIGWVAGKAYKAARSAHLWAIAILGAFYQFTLWGPIASFAAYNIPLVVFVVLLVYLIFVAPGQRLKIELQSK